RVLARHLVVDLDAGRDLPPAPREDRGPRRALDQLLDVHLAPEHAPEAPLDALPALCVGRAVALVVRDAEGVERHIVVAGGDARGQDVHAVRGERAAAGAAASMRARTRAARAARSFGSTAPFSRNSRARR